MDDTGDKSLSLLSLPSVGLSYLYHYIREFLRLSALNVILISTLSIMFHSLYSWSLGDNSR